MLFSRSYYLKTIYGTRQAMLRNNIGLIEAFIPWLINPQEPANQKVLFRRAGECKPSGFSCDGHNDDSSSRKPQALTPATKQALLPWAWI
jgi:hypothetical protein